jgi:hypothetical protein
MIGHYTQFPHTLVPLVVAVAAVRSRIAANARNSPPDAHSLATFIATEVPIFEYFDDPRWLPRRLRSTWQDGVFLHGGAELRFADGRRSKHLLAVQAHDIACVIEMLNRPDHALQVRAGMLHPAAARVRQNSRALRKEAADMRAGARRARSAAETLRAPGQGARR